MSLNHLDIASLDLSGSGEVLPTQSNLTAIVEKLNIVIDELNSIDRVKNFAPY